MSPLDAQLEAFINEQRQRTMDYDYKLPFTREEYRDRQTRVRDRMERDGIDLLLVTSPEAICWLTGHALRWNKGQSPTAWPGVQSLAVQVDSDRPILFETAEHELMIQTRSCVEDYRLSADESLDGMVGRVITELASLSWLHGTVGVEKWSYIPNRAVGAVVENRLSEAGCNIVDASMLLREVRRLKSPRELEYTERAAQICDAGLTALEAAIAPGVTELELWAELTRGLVAAGGEPSALHETVAIGTTELGHAFAGRRVLQRGDYLWADPCGVYNHYHANVAKAWYLGDPPAEAQRIAEIQAGGFDVLLSTARASVPIREVNHALLDYYTDAGVWGLHGWTGGYELGLSFPPDWVGEFVFSLDEPDSDGQFEDGLVTNFESVVGFAMIDTIVYEPDRARRLSRLPLTLGAI